MNWLDGQARTRWRDEQLGRFDNALRYYLGPTGIPDKLNGLARLLEFTDAGDMPEAARASQNLWNDPSLEAAIDYAVSGAALAIPFVGAKMINEGTDILGSAVDDFMTGYDPTVLRAGVGPTAADPAATRGQEILDLLTSGRASEVTDDMLDMGDPVMNARLNEYLWNNYDLPMDEASRMARAEGMGFDTGTPLYHGTTQDFPAFNNDRIGFNFMNGSEYGRGHYATEKPELASGYSEFVNKYKNPGEPNVLPIAARGERYDLPFTGTGETIEAARAINFDDYDGVNVRKPDNYVYRGDNDYTNAPIQEASIFDPANIRSRFARFDPRLSHLRNLSAGIGALTLADILAKYGLQQDATTGEAMAAPRLD